MARYNPDAPPKTGEDLLAAIGRAHSEVSELCHGKHWRMSVPVEDTDSDMVIADALRDAAREIKQLQAELAALRLPVVTRPDHQTERQAAIAQAQAWQRSVARENTPTPSVVYLIVRDLLAQFPFEDLSLRLQGQAPQEKRGHIDPDCEVVRGVGWMCTCETPEEKAERQRETAEGEAERDAEVLPAVLGQVPQDVHALIRSVRNSGYAKAQEYAAVGPHDGDDYLCGFLDACNDAIEALPAVLGQAHEPLRALVEQEKPDAV